MGHLLEGPGECEWSGTQQIECSRPMCKLPPVQCIADTVLVEKECDGCCFLARWHWDGGFGRCCNGQLSRWVGTEETRRLRHSWAGYRIGRVGQPNQALKKQKHLCVIFKTTYAYIIYTFKHLKWCLCAVRHKLQLSRSGAGLTAQGHELSGAVWFSALKCRAGDVQISSFAKEDGVGRCVSQANMRLYLWVYSTEVEWPRESHYMWRVSGEFEEIT